MEETSDTFFVSIAAQLEDALVDARGSHKQRNTRLRTCGLACGAF